MSPPSSPPDVLLLDVMDTIVREPWFEDAPVWFGMSLDELYAVKDPDSWILFEKGVIDEATFFETFFTDRRPFDGPAFVAHMRAGYRFLPGMEGLLNELSTVQRPVHALSNYPVWYRHIEEDLELSRFLEWSFVSCLTGVRKPDPEAYLGAARALDVAAGGCLLVDDRPENIEAARSVGMRAVLFTGADALRGALAEQGVLG